MSFNPCVVIPHYNHSDLLPKVLTQLESFGLPILIVDDGSSDEHREQMRRISKQYSNIEVKETARNSGKGHAVMTGLRCSFEKGFSHAIQIDGDGQHDIQALAKLIETAKERPRDVISGYPVYSDDIPKVRKYGRYITHFWVWVETLSFDIKDSMCGFRVYPLKECMNLFARSTLSPRMEFDTEVMVKLHWSGLQFQHLPVKVSYPADGRSHFRYFKDNARLIWAHTKMVLGMLVRAPKWLVLGRKQTDDSNWMTKPEAGSVAGIKLLLGIYSLLGRPALNFILYFVAAYYYVFHSTARQSSQEYLEKYKNYFGSEAQSPLSTFRHIYEFAVSLLDKIAVWRGEIELSHINFREQHIMKDLVARKQGAVFLTSHFGNLEICRAWAREWPDVKLNAVFYIRNAEKFNSVLKAVSPDVSLNVYSPHEMSVETGILFKQKVDQGEWIFVMADRILADTKSRVVKSRFLGEPVDLPMGPFAMADVMQVPVFAMHCYKASGRFQVSIEPIVAKNVHAKRTDKFKELADEYIKVLESLVKIAPLQWFNFYRFWKSNDSTRA